MPELPEVDVDVQEETRPFWEGLARGEVVVSWCDGCDDHVWPPKAVCPACLGAVSTWRQLSGEGEVYSYSVVHRGEGVWAKRDPYALVYVTLDGGPTIMANVVPVEGVHVGQRVRLVPRDGSAETGHVGAVFEPV